MLVVLQERGYIAQEPLSARYILTTFIFELAHRIPKLRRLTALGAPMMRGLAGRVSQSVHLTQENRLKARGYDFRLLPFRDIDRPKRAFFFTPLCLPGR